MPRPERSHRFQDAVYWPFTGRDEYGEATRGAPVAIKVRWTYVRRMTRNAQGMPITTDATIDVDRLIAAESLMWLGRLADFVDDGNQVVMEVLVCDVVPDMRNRITDYEVGAAFYKRNLPPVTA